jgi:hypothetical protein
VAVLEERLAEVQNESDLLHRQIALLRASEAAFQSEAKVVSGAGLLAGWLAMSQKKPKEAGAAWQVGAGQCTSLCVPALKPAFFQRLVKVWRHAAAAFCLLLATIGAARHMRRRRAGPGRPLHHAA